MELRINRVRINRVQLVYTLVKLNDKQLFIFLRQMCVLIFTWPCLCKLNFCRKENESSRRANPTVWNNRKDLSLFKHIFHHFKQILLMHNEISCSWEKRLMSGCGGSTLTNYHPVQSNSLTGVPRVFPREISVTSLYFLTYFTSFYRLGISI